MDGKAIARYIAGKYPLVDRARFPLPHSESTDHQLPSTGIDIAFTGSRFCG